MTNGLKNSLYAVAGTALVATNSLNAIAFNVKGSQSSNVTQLEGNNATDMVTVVTNIIGFVVGLLYLIAVVYTLYGGFQILTAGGDEEKVTKGKDTIVRGAIGLAVIFLASTVVNWIISLFGTGGAATN